MSHVRLWCPGSLELPFTPGGQVCPCYSDEHDHRHPDSLVGCRLIPAPSLSVPWPAEPAAVWHPGDLSPLAHHRLPSSQRGLVGGWGVQARRAPVTLSALGGGLLLPQLMPLCHFCKMGHVPVCDMVSAPPPSSPCTSKGGKFVKGTSQSSPGVAARWARAAQTWHHAG